MTTLNDLIWSGDKDIERIADLLLAKIKVVSTNESFILQNNIYNNLFILIKETT